MIGFGCLERPLANFFYNYGSFVSRNPYPFIAGPILLTLALSVGFFHLEIEQDAIYLFTPTDAPSKTERQIIHELWPVHENNFVPGRGVVTSREAQITVVARNGGNILEPHYAVAIHRLDSYIQNRIQVRFHDQIYTYRELCLKYGETGCVKNDHIQIITELYNHGFNITYPYFRVGNRGGYIGSALGGVAFGRGDNGTVLVSKARAWLLLYQLKFHPANMSYISAKWEKAFKEHLSNYPPDPLISITYFHSQTLADELTRNAESLVPKFITSFVMLLLFAVACSIVNIHGTPYIDWVLSKPILSILGVFNAGMGIASAVGGLVLLGVPYTDIVAVMPFLVVAVGTDNMFLMVACVRRTNRSWTVEQRIGECMSDAAVSISITALTDAFSFGVGTITTIPAVQIFCLYTCLALVLTFLYQVTFFCALLSLATEWEARGLHCILLRQTVPPKLQTTSSIIDRVLWLGSRPHPDPKNPINKRSCTATRFFQDVFAPILMHPAMKCMATLWYFIYLGFAIYGCTQLREGLEPVNLLVDDSYATPHYRVLEKYFWKYGATVQIVVSNPPDLTKPNERQIMKEMAHEFATTKHSMGDGSIQWWMPEMERYYGDRVVENSTQEFLALAANFFYEMRNDPWPVDVKWKRVANGKYDITAFRFLVGMKSISSTTDQQEATTVFREVASRYSQYNVTTYMPLWLFTDQYALVVPNTVQDIVVAVLCMLMIAFVLIPQPFCALWVAFTIGSIDVGVLGFMTLWGVNLDAISMITIIMSVGFSVDYAAHITYGYVISKEPLARHRVRDALGDLGWPVVQGAASTILAVIVLADVPAYMIVTFFKTVFLAITIGLVHGLIFLPLMLSVFVRGCCTVGYQHKDEERFTLPIPPGSYSFTSADNPVHNYGTNVNYGNMSKIANMTTPPVAAFEQSTYQMTEVRRPPPTHPPPPIPRRPLQPPQGDVYEKAGGAPLPPTRRFF
ncbi:unnamed protein product, partial [Mesorhabditis belari]|uniref:SSD domain-containing protein n=1 Tax=Mesorhabditis belari TaxID=2138241 RepID=A0AAF3FEK4_9BILA